MERGHYVISAEWDPEASVWVASSDDVPGLATGADTLDGLIAKLKVVIPELLEANGISPQTSGGEIAS
ncbi:MAG: DUF1902 domain-containing protein [Rhodospirillales bacterium]